ncbi:YHS domain-containing (seleno)protein [uncultured Aquimarina sp.]|uniref:YHS domain-containing (seleno)protein n=1 Tax=uncultured Aquimarina sp. TaxID=575652 RepID=UPI0026139560|nr:YHS domain-containing (seleno)protein [uncultured Aquimarina sp.]
MKKIILGIFIMLIAGFTLQSFTSNSDNHLEDYTAFMDETEYPIITKANKKSHNIDDNNIALLGYSPVSYLDLQLAQLGNKNFKAQYDGVTYYFTSAEQANTFKANPTKYLPQYGGFCATGVNHGAKFRPDPNKFIVKNDKYFLFSYNKIEGSDAIIPWMQGNHKELVKVADKNWSKLSNSY